MNTKYLTENARITDAYSKILNESACHAAECVRPKRVKQFEQVDTPRRRFAGLPLKPRTSLRRPGLVSHFTKFEDKPNYRSRFSKTTDFSNVRTIKESRNKRVDDDFLEQDIEDKENSLYNEEYCVECDELLTDTRDVFEQIREELSDDSLDLVDELVDRIETHLSDDEDEETDDGEVINEDKLSNAYHKAAEKAGKATEKAAEKAGKATEKAAEKAGKATEKAGKATEKAAEKGTEKTVKSGLEHAQKETRAAKKSLREIEKELKAALENLPADARKVVENNASQVEKIVKSKGKNGAIAWIKKAIHNKKAQSWLIYAVVFGAGLLVHSLFTGKSSSSSSSSTSNTGSSNTGKDVLDDATSTDSDGYRMDAGQDRYGMNPGYGRGFRGDYGDGYGRGYRRRRCNRWHQGEGGVIGNLGHGLSSVVDGVGGLVATPFKFVSGGLDRATDHLVGRTHDDGYDYYDDDGRDGYGRYGRDGWYPFNDYGPERGVAKPHDTVKTDIDFNTYSGEDTETDSGEDTETDSGVKAETNSDVKAETNSDVKAETDSGVEVYREVETDDSEEPHAYDTLSDITNPKDTKSATTPAQAPAQNTRTQTPTPSTTDTPVSTSPTDIDNTEKKHWTDEELKKVQERIKATTMSADSKEKQTDSTTTKKTPYNPSIPIKPIMPLQFSSFYPTSF